MKLQRFIHISLKRNCNRKEVSTILLSYFTSDETVLLVMNENVANTNIDHPKVQAGLM
jgi:hypothetical protein